MLEALRWLLPSLVPTVLASIAVYLTDKRREPKITTRVPCADWFERRDAALMAHATQVDPDGWFFKVPLAVQRGKGAEVWGWGTAANDDTPSA